MKNALPPTEIQSFLQTHPDWKLQNEKLIKEWLFKDFVQAIAFVNQIAEIAESANHHPDIDIRYNKVLLSLTSHDANGITQRDLAMATRLGTI